MSNVIARDVLKNMSVSDLLNTPISQIEAAASFVLPPEGAYIFRVVSAGLTTIGTGDKAREAFGFTLAVDSILAQVNDTDKPVDIGAEFDINYIGGQGVSYMMRDFIEVSTTFGDTILADFGAKVTGCKIQAVLTHRPDATDPTKKYPQLQEITLV